jgi:hypothetical protein
LGARFGTVINFNNKISSKDPLDLNTQIHLLSAISVFAAGIIPLFLSLKLKRNIKKLVIVFFVFILIHGMYHIFELSSNRSIGEDIFEPLSVAILIGFGLMYIKSSREVIQH